jgi:hypothetical protein
VYKAGAAVEGVSCAAHDLSSRVERWRDKVDWLLESRRRSSLHLVILETSASLAFADNVTCPSVTHSQSGQVSGGLTRPCQAAGNLRLAGMRCRVSALRLESRLRHGASPWHGLRCDGLAL